MWLQCDKGDSECQTSRTRASLELMLAMVSLLPINWLIFYLCRRIFSSPYESVDWTGAIIGATLGLGITLFAVCVLCIRDAFDARDKYTLSGRAKSKNTKDISKLFDEL